MRAPARAAALVAAALLGLGGCSSYVATSESLRPMVAAENYDAALQRIRGLDSGTSRLLYLYERGLILHAQARFEASNAALDSAETLLEDLYTRSISREAAALLVSEGTREYRGERFESAFVHYYRIMNYLNLGDLQSAAVQARRLGERLSVLSDQAKSVYPGDPFLEYLTGMVFTAAGEPGEAAVSYRRAVAAYRDTPQAGDEMPPRLFCDLADCAAALGDEEEEAASRRDGDCVAPGDRPPGTVRLFLECGYVDYRIAKEIFIPIFKNEIHDDMDVDAFAATLVDRYGRPVPQKVEVEYMLRVSLPELVATPSGIARARIWARPSDGHTPPHGDAVVAADVSARARTAFAAAQPAIFARAVVRGLAKYLAKRKAEKEGGSFAGFATNVAAVLTETADTRCWSLLPEKILLGQLDLPEGDYSLRVELQGPDGGAGGSFEIPEVRVTSGKSTFLDYRVH